MLAGLKQKDFAPHVNSTFTITAQSGERAEVVLVEVTGKEDAYTESFSLMFKGEKPNVLAQDMHTVTHAKLGSFDMFLGPVHTGKTDAVYYEAVFNRLKNQ